MNPKDIYIQPITKVHTTFAEAKEFFDKFGGLAIFEDEEITAIDGLAQGNRSLIVGEPGIGKTLLLQKIHKHLEAQGTTTVLVSLRDNDALQQIDSALGAEQKPQALLLDALDEVKSSTFPAVLQKIEEISKAHPELQLFISGRWVFVSRYANSFPEFRFISISPFTRSQIREYLISAGRAERDVDTLLNRMMSFSHRMLVIQIPRYLFYLDDYLKVKGLDAAAKVSRNELFEHFIYKKLELEEKKLNEDKRAITKRVLEKLALGMEIYQTNVITQDELMTFFDDLKSDLKTAALSSIGIDVFYEYSLLKVSHENLDKIEFENTEFQEYLAAKEITRFADPNRAAFAFAVDPNVKEIYPTWFNALTFLVDMQPNLLEQFVEFSGLRGNKFKVLDENFFHFLSRVDPRNVPAAFRIALFKDVIEYHRRTRQWISGQITQALPDFYDPSLESQLKVWVTEAESQKDAFRYVPLGNICYVVAYLLRNKISVDKPYWREKLIAYAQDKDENGVLQRHALEALEDLGDPSVIDVLTQTQGDELVSQAFLSACIALDPDHPKTLQHVFEAVARDDFHGRYGLFEFKKRESVVAFLRRFIDDENFRREFLDDTRIFRDKDHVIVDRIKAVADNEIRELSKGVLVKSVHHSVAYNTEQSVFLQGLWDFLSEGDPSFVMDMVRRIKESEDGKTGLYFAHSFFARTIKLEDVQPFVQALLNTGEKYSAFTVMTRIKFSRRKNANELYEACRSLLADDYQKWEEGQAKAAANPQDDRGQGLLQEFRVLLEPEEGKYSTNVFDFYTDHADMLDPLLSNDDKKRIFELLSGTVFKFMDPGKFDLTITAQHDGSKTYTTASAIYIFRDALVAAKRLGFDTSPYRQQIINLIPFAYNEDLRTIFDLVKDIKPEEMTRVFEVYTNKSSDLWRHMPQSFVEAAKQYHITAAAPILKGLIMEEQIEKYVREEALPVFDSLAPDASFLKEVFEKYKDSKDAGDQKLAHIASGLLITSHADADAIRWRLKQIVERAGPFTQVYGARVHSVGDFEDEISHSKTFAKPLMELKYSGFEQDYLDMLNEAFKIWARGPQFHAYGQYMWEVVYAYFDNLKEGRSYDSLQQLETAVANVSEQDGVNWFAGRLAHLRKSYLGYLGKPQTIAEAITKYNDAREFSDKKVRNSEDLFRQVQDALETDLRRWIEGEGAYDILLRKKSPGERRDDEKLVQKTLKMQIENILLKRGFQVEITREAQLLNEKRTDLLVRYGFTGPIVIEVKLTSNSDIQSPRVETIEKSDSYVTMRDAYMQGYGASHGIFLVVKNTDAKNLSTIQEAFQKINKVSVMSFDCYNSPTAPKRKTVKNTAKRPKKKTSSHAVRRRSGVRGKK